MRFSDYLEVLDILYYFEKSSSMLIIIKSERDFFPRSVVFSEIFVFLKTATFDLNDNSTVLTFS